MSLTVHLGDIPLVVDTGNWNELIGQQLAHAFDYEDLSPAKRTVVRIGMKVLMHEVLSRFERASLAGAISAPPPDQDRADADVLTYGASYIAAFLIAELEKLSFVADFEEEASGAIRITGLHPAPAVAAPEAGATLFLASGPENGPDSAEALAAAATPQPAEPIGAGGVAGGHVDAGGDQGQREDVRGEATSAGALETVS